MNNTMIRNTYELSKQPSVEDLLADSTTSYWLKNNLATLLERDLLKTIKDIELLHAVLVDRFERHLTK